MDQNTLVVLTDLQAEYPEIDLVYVIAFQTLSHLPESEYWINYTREEKINKKNNKGSENYAHAFCKPNGNKKTYNQKYISMLSKYFQVIFVIGNLNFFFLFFSVRVAICFINLV